MVFYGLTLTMIVYFRDMVGKPLNCSGMSCTCLELKTYIYHCGTLPFPGIAIVAKRKATAIMPWIMPWIIAIKDSAAP